MRTYTLRVEADDPDQLVPGIRELERAGCRVECRAHDARERLKSRDGFLMQALQHMPGDTPRKKCRELAAAIAKFEGTTWPRWRDHGTPPGGSVGVSTVQSCLFEARQLGRLPSTPEQLLNIVAKSRPSCNLVEPFSESEPDPS